MSPHVAHLLEHLLGSKSKIAVLRLLLGTKIGYSGNSIARRCGMGLLSIQNALADLEQLGLVEVERGAVEYRYRLNFNHYLVENGLRALFDGERDMVQSLTTELKHLLDGKAVSAGLFGSFVRGEAKAASDINLLVIVRGEKEREQVSELLSDISLTISERYGLPLQPIILERRQVAIGRGNTQSLLSDAERDWLHVAGAPLPSLRRKRGSINARMRKTA